MVLTKVWKKRPSFEIIPKDPREALIYYQSLLADIIKPDKPLNQEEAAVIISQVQNARLNIRALKKRIHDAK